MSKAVNAIIVGLTVFILLTGSIWYVTVARGPNKVSAVEVEQGWDSVNETTSVLWGQVTFRNPYDFRIELTSFTYEFWVNEERWARHNSTDVVTLTPRGEAILPARIEMNTTEMDEWFLDHIANGERTLVLFTGNASFRVGGGEISVPFEERRTWDTGLRRNIEEIRNCPQAEPLPCIADASVKWVLEDEKSLLQLVFTIRNNNLDEMTISNRSAVLAIGGVPIAKANATDNVAVARQSGRFFEFPMEIDRGKIIDWWIHHVQACENTDATLDLVFDYEVKAATFPPQPTLPTSTSATPPSPTTTSSQPPPPPPTTTTTAPPPPTTTTTAPPPPPTTTTTAEPPPPTTTTTAEPPPPTTTTGGESPPPTTTTDAGTGGMSSSSSSSQSFGEGMRKIFEYPWRAASVQLGLVDLAATSYSRPTTNGVERIAWDLELGTFETGFACDLES